MFLTKTPSTLAEIICFVRRFPKTVEGMKMLRVMKLTTILLLAAVVHVSAKGTAQTITFTAKSEPLVRVLSIIKEQTGYAIVYRKEDLRESRKVSVSLKDADIKTALEEVLQNQALMYVIEGRTVVISLKKGEKKPSVIEVLDHAPPVRGVVRSVDGQPLAGVNIIVKRANRGTTTAADGSFEIDAKEGDKLVISSIGYVSKEITVTTSKLLTVSLAVSSSPLDEVQIIAYGETSKRLQIGNVSSIKAREIEKQPVQNPILALQGRVPGVVVEQSTGMPGSGIRVKIQGQNSIAKDNDPLYIVDGVPYYSQMNASLSNVMGESASGPGVGGNPLNFINPLDIASIEVLKDADATAIYGSRGSNGVVLITTKKGKPGELKVDLGLQTGWQKVSRKMDVLNTEQYLEMREEAYKNDGLPVPDANATPDAFNYDLTVWDKTRYTDWQNELIGKTAKYHNAQISFSGGTGQTSYLASGTFHKETSVFQGDFYNQKGSFNFNLNTASKNQRFKFTTTLLYQMDENNLMGVDVTKEAIQLPPNAPALFDASGKLNWEMVNGISTWGNPLRYTENKYEIKTNNIIVTTAMNYELLRGLNIKIPVSFGNLQSNEKLLLPLTYYAPETRASQINMGHIQNANSAYYQLEPQISYKRPWLDGTLEVLLGSALYSSTRKSSGVGGERFSSDLLLNNPSLASTVFAIRPTSSMYKYNALFAKINYNYRDKYVVNLTARRDGSSRFGANNRFHNFGSVGGAWIISSEPFFNSLSSIFSFAKVRASYGSTGNDQIGDYQFLALYGPFFSNNTYQNVPMLTADKLDNFYLQWELTRKFAAGLDLGVIKDRLTVGIDYYRNQSSNQILPYTLPLITGFSFISQNFPATVRNSGVELSIQSQNITTSRFTWSTSFNITVPKNEVVKFDNIANSSYASGDFVSVGQPLNTRLVYSFSGADPQTGIYVFRTADNKQVSMPVYTSDRISRINPAFPRFFGGLSNSLDIGAFHIDFLLSFAKRYGGYYQSNLPGIFVGDVNGTFGNQPTSVLSRWRQPGDISNVQKFSATYPGEMFTAFYSLMFSDAAYQDVTYVQLKNISIGFDILKSTRINGLRSARIFAQGQNLVTLTNYQGLNPDSPSASLVLPPLKVLVVGLNISL